MLPRTSLFDRISQSATIGSGLAPPKSEARFSGAKCRLYGEWELPFAIEKIKQNTRIYSRKQTTWYRRDTDITWFHPDETEQILSFIDRQLKSE